MSVLVYAEAIKGKLKKAAFEAVTYGRKLADMLSEECVVICLGPVENPGDLGIYGAHRVLHHNSNELVDFDSQKLTIGIAEVVERESAHTIVLSHTSSGKSLVGRLSVRLKAGSVSGVNSLPDLSEGFKVTKGVFSGKAFATYSIETEKRIISLMVNSTPVEKMGSTISVEEISLNLPDSRLEITALKVSEGEVPLPEAEIVVSAGRGMKEPGNWGIIEELAKTLGATTACSRPVSDSGWRPHHEHVGQTGIAIRPNLYIAIGISGAIQHLAGVNNSKVIVVINKDPEAPFFKAADYGVCGDLFDVVPELNLAIKKFKAEV